MIWESLNTYWDRPSLIWGEPAGKGEVQKNVSPLGHELQTIRLLDEGEIGSLFLETITFPPSDLQGPRERLAELLKANRNELIAAIRATTAFNLVDCAEILDGGIWLVEHFSFSPPEPQNEYAHEGRRIGLREVPWGTVAAVLPQNAFLTMGLTALLNAIAAGNRVVLRCPTGSAALAAPLARLLLEAGFDPKSFSVVFCEAAPFVAAWEAAEGPVLLHYMGSSGRAGELLAKSFQAGQPCLIDGEGNCWAYVDQDQDPIAAAELLWKGSVRYNGQTCTSVNGVVAHPSVDNALRLRLRELAASAGFGLSENDPVGPLFHVRHANAAEETIQGSGGRIGRRALPQGGLFPPTLIEDPSEDSGLVKTGLFGPAMWVRTGDFDEFERLWKRNRYPLCAAVLSYQENVVQRAASLRGLSRLVLNGDPSLEDPMEPWGGYPPCGSNPVSPWQQKYQRVVQVDEMV